MTARRDDPVRDLQRRIGMSPIKMMACNSEFPRQATTPVQGAAESKPGSKLKRFWQKLQGHDVSPPEQ
jgi:hypothetical protein